jgi:hypothetical protein
MLLKQTVFVLKKKDLLQEEPQLEDFQKQKRTSGAATMSVRNKNFIQFTNSEVTIR